ncbi:MAG: hypothetical protein NZO58_03790 [Gemmataceae bacterium]|nr:hypothetical protein [Gemmataceae bacterium]
MQQRCRIRTVVLAATWFGMVGSLPAQDQLIQKDQVEQFNRIKFSFVSKELVGAEPGAAANFELAARYYVSRVTYDAAPRDPKAMLAVVKDFEDMVSVATSPLNFANSRAPVARLAPLLVARFKEVFALDWKSNQMAQVNAAVLLWHAAKLKNEEIADYLAVVVADPKMHDAVRAYAAKGLAEYMPVNPFTRLDLNQGLKTKQLEERKARELKRVDALLAFIDRPEPPEDVKRKMSEYEINALRYVRRAATTTLAQAATPALSAFDKSGKVEGPVALALIKVLAKKVWPEPQIHERIEAAIGVCQFNKYIEEYDPKIGLYLVADCFADLLNEYKKDHGSGAVKGKGKVPPLLPWKQLSRRIEIALAELTNNHRGTAHAGTVQSIELRMRPMLRSMASGDAIDQELAYRKFAASLRPPANYKTIFRNSAGPLLQVDWEPSVSVDDAN